MYYNSTYLVSLVHQCSSSYIVNIRRGLLFVCNYAQHSFNMFSGKTKVVKDNETPIAPAITPTPV